jgi:membrane protease YdiL (CAAX protease family)
MAWFATVLASLLMLFLIILVPIRGALRYRTLMRRLDRHPELRPRFYLNGMLSQWLLLIPLVIIFLGLRWSPQTLGLQVPVNLWLAVPISVILIVAFYAQVFYIRRTTRTIEGRQQLRQSMSGPLHVLPRTPRERFLWVFLSLTAGFCEELLYRGFIPAYLVHIFPGIPLVFALLISSVLFGLGHIYQKLPGVLGTGIMGLIFGFLYYVTGSLYLSMIIHALFDLRLLVVDIASIVNTPDQAVGEPTTLPS